VYTLGDRFARATASSGDVCGAEHVWAIALSTLSHIQNESHTTRTGARSTCAPHTSPLDAAARAAMDADGADDIDVDIDAFVALGRARLLVLYSLEHVMVNYRSSVRGADVDENVEREEALWACARGFWEDDAIGEASSAAAVKLALCCAEKANDDGSRRLRPYEYGCDWLARFEALLTRVRVANGVEKIPDDFATPDCEFERPEGVENCDVGAWMTFERAYVAARSRRSPLVKDGYVYVTRTLMPDVYAEHRERCIRNDLSATFRRLQLWLSEGRAPPAFDPNASYNALRAIRTWVPDVSELPDIPTSASTTNWGKRRRERRRANGVAQHAIAIEEDVNTTASGAVGPNATYRYIAGEDARRALKMVDRHVSAITARPFPPCMRSKFEELQRKAHLTFTDRFQLNLFLKGIGLTVNETLNFWRQGVFPKGKMKAYQGEHTYNVRHNYGLEGGMIDYTPHNCEKMQQEHKDGAGRCACPFATDIETFRSNTLGQSWYQSVSIDARDKIESAVHAKNPSAACEHVFEDAHGGFSIGPKFEFPDAYYDASMEIEEMCRERADHAQFDRQSSVPEDVTTAAGARANVAADAHPLPTNFNLALEDLSSDDE
jgi:hypothetical protein